MTETELNEYELHLVQTIEAIRNEKVPVKDAAVFFAESFGNLRRFIDLQCVLMRDEAERDRAKELHARLLPLELDLIEAWTVRWAGEQERAEEEEDAQAARRAN